MANNVLAYGFAGLEDVAAQRVSQYGERLVIDAVAESASIYTRQLNAALALFANRTTLGKDLVSQVGGAYSQPLGEFGSPAPLKVPAPISVGFPIQSAGDAFARSHIARHLMTVQEAYAYTVQMMGNDKRTVIRRILSALLDNTSWTFNDVALRLGDITIYPLANGDTQVYLRSNGDIPSTDNHYLAQAAAISNTANPLPTIRTELMEHPGNGNQFVLFASTSLIDSIKGLTDWVPIANPLVVPAMTTATLNGGLDLATLQGPGDLVLGQCDGLLVVEWSALPSGYMLAVATNAGQCLGMREYDSAALQGFYMKNPDESEISKVEMLRHCGFGVRKRVAAVVQYIGGGAYSIPSGFETPCIV